MNDDHYDIVGEDSGTGSEYADKEMPSVELDQQTSAAFVTPHSTRASPRTSVDTATTTAAAASDTVENVQHPIAQVHTRALEALIRSVDEEVPFVRDSEPHPQIPGRLYRRRGFLWDPLSAFYDIDAQYDAVADRPVDMTPEARVDSGLHTALANAGAAVRNALMNLRLSRMSNMTSHLSSSLQSLHHIPRSVKFTWMMVGATAVVAAAAAGVMFYVGGHANVVPLDMTVPSLISDAIPGNVVVVTTTVIVDDDDGMRVDEDIIMVGETPSDIHGYDTQVDTTSTTPSMTCADLPFSVDACNHLLSGWQRVEGAIWRWAYVVDGGSVMDSGNVIDNGNVVDNGIGESVDSSATDDDSTSMGIRSHIIKSASNAWHRLKRALPWPTSAEATSDDRACLDETVDCDGFVENDRRARREHDDDRDDFGSLWYAYYADVWNL